MQLNPSPKTRTLVYLASVFVNASTAVIMTEVKLSIWFLGILAGWNAIVALLAKSNVNS